jgi:hypothetical protein
VRTKTGRTAAVLLCAAGLALAGSEAAARPAPAAGAAEPPVRCLAGVRRVQATSRATPSQRLYAVQNVWIPFTTSGSAPCLKNGGFTRRS